MAQREQAVFVSAPGEGTLAGRGPLVKAFGDHSGDSWAFVEGGLPPKTDGPILHVHKRHGEGFYVVEGTMTLVGADGETEASAGTYAYVPPGVPHTFKNRSSEPLRFVGVCHAGIEQFLIEMNEAMSSDPPDMERLREVCARYESYPV